MISEHTELCDFSPSSFTESSESYENGSLLNANFAKAPMNSYGRPILSVPPMRPEGFIRQIPSLPDNDTNDPASNTNGNGPFKPLPKTPIVMPRMQIPNRIHQSNQNKGILQTPLLDQYVASNAQLWGRNLFRT